MLDEPNQAHPARTTVGCGSADQRRVDAADGRRIVGTTNTRGGRFHSMAPSGFEQPRTRYRSTGWRA
jgi:hypothetical protein